MSTSDLEVASEGQSNTEVEAKASHSQKQTSDAFGFKWAQEGTYNSPVLHEKTARWLMERYCQGDAVALDQMLEGGRKTILDAGCGAGFSALLFFGDRLKDHDYIGLDISSAVDIAKEAFETRSIPARFIRASLLDAPLPAASVDMIFSEGVLHHTDSTEKAIDALAKKLKPDGLFLFYVYAKKAPIREFTDDYIRQQLQSLSDAEAWEQLLPLTKLGQALGNLDIEIDVPEDIPVLGIEQGKINLQRFFYWNICKMYSDRNMDVQTLNHVNFDWFRPLNCHRHSVEEVTAYCARANLTIEHLDVQESGITVVARKRICKTA